MRIAEAVMRRRAVAAALGVAVTLACGWATAQDRKRAVQIIRHEEADGAQGDRINIENVARAHSRILSGLHARFDSMKSAGAVRPTIAAHRTAMLACPMAGERRHILEHELPSQFRGLILYVVRIPRGGSKPAILPAHLEPGAAVLAIESGSPKDLAELSQALGTPVTLSTEKFIRALGVQCADSRVAIRKDGRTIEIQEALP